MRLDATALLAMVRNWRGIRRRFRFLYYSRVLRVLGSGCQICDGVMMFGPENIALGERVILNEGVVLQSCDGAAIELGAHVVVSFGAMILTGGIDLTKDSPARSHVSRPIRVGDYSWIGARAIILPGVSIGPRAVIGAGSVVTRDVPENGRVGGVPARALGVNSVR